MVSQVGLRRKPREWKDQPQRLLKCRLLPGKGMGLQPLLGAHVPRSGPRSEAAIPTLHPQLPPPLPPSRSLDPGGTVPHVKSNVAGPFPAGFCSG